MFWYSQTTAHKAGGGGGGAKQDQAQLGVVGLKENPEKWQDGRPCWRTAGLLGGGRGELHPRENGRLDPWGGMLLVGARIWKVPHLHTQKQQGPGKGTFKGHTEKKGSPAQDISAIRLTATSSPVLAALQMHEFMIACYVQWGTSLAGETYLLEPGDIQQGRGTVKLLLLSG